MLIENESRLKDYVTDEARDDYHWPPYEKDMRWFPVLLIIKQEETPHIPIMMHVHGGEYPCHMMLSMAASTHDLKVSKTRGEYSLAFVFRQIGESRCL